MMNGVNQGNIGCIIVKDMSRLGRDYLKVGQCMEILRQKGVRLIAINDNVDSFYREDDETYMNPIDRLFEALEKKEPTHFAVKQYKKYKLAAGVIELRRTLNHCFSEICTS